MGTLVSSITGWTRFGRNMHEKVSRTCLIGVKDLDSIILQTSDCYGYQNHFFVPGRQAAKSHSVCMQRSHALDISGVTVDSPVNPVISFLVLALIQVFPRSGSWKRNLRPYYHHISWHPPFPRSLFM